MTRKILSIVLFVPAALIVSVLLPQLVFSAADHLVISEIQIEGASAEDEFVELYNPTSSPILVDGWRLTKKTSGGSESNLASSLSGTVPANGYFLIAHSDITYDSSVQADLYYSAPSNNIASNNSVILYSDAGVTLVDKVGLGTATDFESAPVPNPAIDGSAQRLPVDEDTDDNSLDFSLSDISDPQNSSFSSASPTPSPSSTPEPSESPSPSPSPASTPTSSPTPSPTSTSAPTPTVTPAPTPFRRTLAVFKTRLRTKVCYLEYRSLRLGFSKIRIPRLVCESR